MTLITGCAVAQALC